MPRTKKCKHDYEVIKDKEFLELFHLPYWERTKKNVFEKCHKCNNIQEVTYTYKHDYQLKDSVECRDCQLEHLHIGNTPRDCIVALSREIRSLQNQVDYLENKECD